MGNLQITHGSHHSLLMFLRRMDCVTKEGAGVVVCSQPQSHGWVRAPGAYNPCSGKEISVFDYFEGSCLCSIPAWNSLWREGALDTGTARGGKVPCRTLCVSKGCPPKPHQQPLESPGHCRTQPGSKGSDKDLAAFWSPFSSFPHKVSKNATQTNACDLSVISPPCQREAMTTQLSDSPMLNTLNSKQAIAASFQSHSPAVGLSLQYCSAELLFFACFLINFTVNLSFSDQSDL